MLERRSGADLYRQFGQNPSKEGDKAVVNDFRKNTLHGLKESKEAWDDLRLPYDTAWGVVIVTPSAPPTEQVQRSFPRTNTPRSSS